MGTYALDPTNPLIRQAMLEEGVLPSELLLRSLHDFADPQVSPEIQQLRFDFHTRRVRGVVKIIKQRLKQAKSQPTFRITAVSCPAKPSPKAAPKPSAVLAPVLSVPILNLLSPTMAQVTQKLEQAEELKSQIRQNQAQLSEQKRSHERFVREMEQNQAQLHKDLIRNLAQTGEKVKKPEQKGDFVEERRVTCRKQWRNPPILSEKNDDIEAKLQTIEAKIEANRVQKEIIMKEKAQHAAKTTAKATEYASQLDSLRYSLEEERIKQYIAKQQLLEDRLKAAKDSRPESKAKSPSLNKSPPSRPAHLATERLSTPSMQDFTLRTEEMRLKDEVKWTKVERARRRFVSFTQEKKRAMWMDKLQTDRSRIDLLKEVQEIQKAKRHATSIQMMIVREQGQELQAQVQHSPESRTVIEKLIALQIVEPPRKKQPLEVPN